MKTNDLTGAVKAFQQSVTLEPDVSCLKLDVSCLISVRSTCPKRCSKKEYIGNLKFEITSKSSEHQQALLQFLFLSKPL